MVFYYWKLTKNQGAALWFLVNITVIPLYNPILHTLSHDC